MLSISVRQPSADQVASNATRPVSELKRRHHYVWQHYLRAWERDGVVACLRGSRLFATGTTTLAVETDFYRVTDLSTNEQLLVARLALTTPDPLMRQMNAGWLEMFLAPAKLRKIAQDAQVHEELLEQFEVAYANLEEELHCKIEEAAIPHIDELRFGRLEFLNASENRTAFLHFLTTQCLRTRKMLDAMLYALPAIDGVRIDRVWSVLRHCFATNIGLSLSRLWEQTDVALLHAPHGSEFITSDQPTVNLHARGKPRDEPVDHVVIYCPLSPKLALRWDPTASARRLHQVVATVKEVDDMNGTMAEMSHTQLYASYPGALEKWRT